MASRTTSASSSARISRVSGSPPFDLSATTPFSPAGGGADRLTDLELDHLTDGASRGAYHRRAHGFRGDFGRGVRPPGMQSSSRAPWAGLTELGGGSLPIGRSRRRGPNRGCGGRRPTAQKDSPPRNDATPERSSGKLTMRVISPVDEGSARGPSAPDVTRGKAARNRDGTAASSRSVGHSAGRGLACPLP